MNKGIINDLIKNFEIKILERHLIYAFLTRNDIQYERSPVLSELFSDFSAIPEVWLTVSTLELKNLKDLEHTLELLTPNTDRKLNGAFFTPTHVVEFIINEVAPKEKDRCLDPSSGCGAFLIGLIDYFKNTFNKHVKNIVRENIYGSDILDYNISRTKTIISIYELMSGEIIEERDFNLFFQDSLREQWDTKFDVIVGNPPYVKYQDLSDNNRRFLTSQWETINSGAFNLYFVFFELGFKLLNDEGRLGYITPNNYFTSLSAQSLRSFFY
ncbi:MAG: N-6 DNA methylase [Ekhidna sp.]|nr:N-6 DNA methylase [Ekhidna sp.]